MADLNIPAGEVDQFIANLAKQNGLTNRQDGLPSMAITITRLAGDEVELDLTANLMIELANIGVISPEVVVSIQNRRIMARPKPLNSQTSSKPFDPFGDFHEKGYLCNRFGIKNPEIIKELEHMAFASNIGSAIQYLEKQPRIGYQQYLHVHLMIFGSLYPWAGQDRAQTAPGKVIFKGSSASPNHTVFAPASECQRSVEYGLNLAHGSQLRNRLGEIMGYFAYGHPFLDGNGRAMMLVVQNLCQRMGVIVRWNDVDPAEFLRALSGEIEKPGEKRLDGLLDDYME